MTAGSARKVGQWAAQALARTWRLDVSGEQHVARLRAAGLPVVFAVWHSQLLAPLWHRRREGISLLVSSHADGARLAAAATQWGYRVILGSSTRGGAGGLRRVVRTLVSGGEAAFAPDGPRGPPRVAKLGAVAAAQYSGAYIVPVSSSASTAWRARSWDAFQIPRPFARVRIVYGRPFRVGRGTAGRAGARERLQNELCRVEQQAQC
ncbi:MAG: DUF374 domain-containing protein [Gemmatimonadales bacterium]|nr:DUF374 domain-containing protein [Gemmatimonadales bacterium]